MANREHGAPPHSMSQIARFSRLDYQPRHVTYRRPGLAGPWRSFMRRIAFAVCVVFALTLAHVGQARSLYRDGFDPPVIAPLFPPSGDSFQLPPGPVSAQLEWLMSELAAGETTTLGEINQHFDASWLAQIPATQTQTFINNIRNDYPDAVIRDVVMVTPVRATDRKSTRLNSSH